MPIELILHLADDTTEEEQKMIAAVLQLCPIVTGVYRQVFAQAQFPTTHPAPGATQ